MKKYRPVKKIKDVSDFNPEVEAFGIYRSIAKENYLFYNESQFMIRSTLGNIVSYKSGLLLWYIDGVCEYFEDGVFVPVTELSVEMDILTGGWLKISSFNFEDCRNYENLMDLSTKLLILKEYIPYDLYCENDVIIAYNNFKGELKRINTYTESLWEFPLCSLGDAPYAIGESDKIQKILGIVHNRLWFYTDFGRLVSLNVDTGDIVKVFSCEEEDEKRGFYFSRGLGRLYLHDDLNIYGIGSAMFTIIDTYNCSIIERYNTQESDPEGIGIYNSVFKPLLQGDYFTFIGEKPLESYGCGWIGIFDYKARQLVWEYELLPQEERKATRTYISPTDQLYMSGNKLYIKDSKRTLHIFERED